MQSSQTAMYCTADWKLSLTDCDLSDINGTLDCVSQCVRQWIAEKDKMPEKYAYKQSSFQQPDPEQVIEYPISVYKVTDKSTKKNIFITEAVVPEADPINVLKYYSDPVLRSQYEYDTMDYFRLIFVDSLTSHTSDIIPDEEDSSITHTMSDLTISDIKDDSKQMDEEDEEEEEEEKTVTDVSVSQIRTEFGSINEKDLTLSVVKVKQLGPVSPRLYLTVSRIECASPDRCQLIGTFLRNDKMKEYIHGKTSSMRMSHPCTLEGMRIADTSTSDVTLGVARNHLLGLSKADLSEMVVGRNLNVNFTVEKHPTREGCCSITYVLQVDVGGWIPQFATDLGIVDQHLIKLFQRMCQWLLAGRKPIEPVSS